MKILGAYYLKTNMKNCIKCKVTKDLTEFGTVISRKDGLDCYCKTCRKEYYKNKNYNRKLYQSSYKRVITSERKQYLKQYGLNNQHKYCKPSNKKSIYKYSSREIKSINNLVWRTLHYKNETKLKLSKDYLGWTKNCFIQKFGLIPCGYHIDHKVPVSWFLKNTPIILINNLENLQLLPAIENIKKRNKFSHPISKQYYNSILIYINTSFINKLQIF